LGRREPPASRVEVLQGTLDLIILQTLRWGPAHGYGILRQIRSQSANVLRVETGSLYPALQRLVRQRLVVAEWTVSENNRRVRSYRLTAKGRARLATERSWWERVSAAMAALMLPPVKEER
jgi:PadR family transcriptional regulator, regulatory protein PadR